MASITPGKLILLVISILTLIVSIIIAVLLITGVAGLAPDNFCKINAAMNSATPLHMWKVAPNFACHSKHVELNADGGSGIIESSLGASDQCECGSFYAPTLDYNPPNLIDQDVSTPSRLSIEDNSSVFFLTTENNTQLGSVEILFTNPVDDIIYTVHTKEKNYFWTTNIECTTGDFTGSNLVINSLNNCSIDNPDNGVRIKFENLDSNEYPLYVNEVRLYNDTGGLIKLDKASFTYVENNELQDKCLEASFNAGIEECTPTWETNWIKKRIIELSTRCWEMGGLGRYYGEFGCFEGCVYYDSASGNKVTQASIMAYLNDLYVYSSSENDYVKYSEIFSPENLNIQSNNFLENNKCYYIRYSKIDKPSVIVSFGRTVAEARLY